MIINFRFGFQFISRWWWAPQEIPGYVWLQRFPWRRCQATLCCRWIVRTSPCRALVRTGTYRYGTYGNPRWLYRTYVRTFAWRSLPPTGTYASAEEELERSIPTRRWIDWVVKFWSPPGRWQQPLADMMHESRSEDRAGSNFTEFDIRQVPWANTYFVVNSSHLTFQRDSW